MPFTLGTNYTVTIRSTLRTSTINEQFTHTVATGSLPTSATPVAQDFVNVITNGGLTAKSIQGHISFPALSGREIGGQARYYTEYDATTPSLLQAASAFAVEPEHRISFAFAPSDFQKTGQSDALNLAKLIIRKIQEGLYEFQLYKHGDQS